MNKKQLSEFAQTIAEQISKDNAVTIEEAQTLVGMALKRLAPKIVELATPKTDVAV